MKYETAYFCGYAKLPTVLPTTTTNNGVTLGLVIEIESGKILNASVTFLSEIAVGMVRSYVVDKNIVDDFDEMTEEIMYRHQGVAAKPLIKALSDIRRNYIEYMEKYSEVLK